MSTKPSCWPTLQQELLLKASLLQGEAALAAWREWQSLVALDDLDLGSFRMLPRLYRNLRDQGVREPAMDRLKEIYQLTWSQNQLLFHGVAPLLRALHEAGIRVMVLKGAALVLHYYHDYGLRPMVDFDLLVPTEQALDAVHLLLAQGWKPKGGAPEDLGDLHFSMRHAEELKDSAGHAVDLHWHLLPEGCYPGADHDFWEQAAPITISGVPASVPSATDHLLHACVHGTKYRPVPQFRWVADVMAILSTAETEIDWPRLVAQAEKRRLILPVRAALQYVRHLLAAPVPGEILAAWQQAPVSSLERLEYRVTTRPFGLLGKLPLHWTRYARYCRGSNSGLLRPKFLGFVRYLQQHWQMEHEGRVLRRVVSRGWEKLGDRWA